MRTYRLFTSVALLALSASTAFADCPITQEEIKATLRAFPAAQAAERASRPKEALALYVQAQGPTCDPNPNAVAAARRAAALAPPLAAAAEQKGQWADAFELHEQGGHYAAADRALMQLLRRHADDVKLVGQHYQHFRQRAEGSFAANNRAQLAAAGPYVLDEALKRELEAMPSKGIERAMAKETSSFNELYLAERMRLTQSRPEPGYNAVAAMQSAMEAEQTFRQKWPADLVKQSQEQLQLARQWASLASNDALQRSTDAQTLARAESRAATLTSKYAGAPEFLDAAADYYRSVDHLKTVAPQLAKITAQATTLGDQAQARGKLTLAIAYYEVADADDKADAARAQQRQVAMTQAQPDIDAARKAAEAMAAQFDPATVERMRKEAQAMKAAIEASKKSQPARAQEKSDLERELGIK